MQEDDTAPVVVDLEAHELAVKHEQVLRGEVASLQQQVTDLKDEISTRNHEIVLLKQEVTTRNHEIGTCNQQIVALNQQIVRLNQQIVDLTRSFDGVWDKVRALESDLYRWARLTDHYQSAVQSGLADLQAKIQQLPPDITP